MKHRLAFFTSTRSDMTIFEPLLNEIKKNKNFEYLLFVHGTHLEKNYGNTIQDIKKLNFEVKSKFFSVDKMDDEFGLVKSLEMTQKGGNLNAEFSEGSFQIKNVGYVNRGYAQKLYIISEDNKIILEGEAFLDQDGFIIKSDLIHYDYSLNKILKSINSSIENNS